MQSIPDSAIRDVLAALIKCTPRTADSVRDTAVKTADIANFCEPIIARRLHATARHLEAAARELDAAVAGWLPQ